MRPSLPAQRPPAIAIAIGPFARSAGVPSTRLDLDRLLDRAARQHLVPFLVEALDHRAELELGGDVAQLRAVGDGAGLLG